MRLIFKDFADHVGAAIARPDFHEHARAVLIRLPHNRRKINSIEDLRQNRIRRAVRCDRVGFAPRRAVKADALRRGRAGEIMEGAIRLRHRLDDLAMRRRDAADERKRAAQFCQNALDRASVAADDAAYRRVDNQQIDARAALQRGANRFRRTLRRRNHPIYGRSCRKMPRLRHCSKFAGEVMRVKRRRHNAAQHFVALLPDAQREQRRRFAERVAD